MRRFRIIIIGLPLLLLAGFGLLKHGILAKHRATQAQRFVASAMQGDLIDVKALLAEGIDPDVKIKFGGHPFGSPQFILRIGSWVIQNTLSFI